MAEAETKVKHEVEIKAPKMPFGTRLYHGWVGAISRLKSSPLDIKSPRGAAARKRDWSHGRGSIYTAVPQITDANIQEMGFYGVVEPFSYIRATFNSATSEYVLNIIEPTVDRGRRGAPDTHQGNAREDARI